MQMSNEKPIYWRTDEPNKVGNYIIDLGGFGVSWGWWTGERWHKLWFEHTFSKDSIEVYGWLTPPLHREQDNEHTQEDEKEMVGNQ